MRIWDLEAVEAAFSDAALNPAAWTRALNVVTTQTEAFGAILVPIAGNHLPNVPFSDRMEQSVDAYSFLVAGGICATSAIRVPPLCKKMAWSTISILSV